MLKELGMEDCKPADTPQSEEIELDETLPLGDVEYRSYRRVNGVLQYISKYRPDVQYAIKEVGRRAHAPTEYAMRLLKRLVRYLQGTRKLGLFFPAAGPWDAVKVHTDSEAPELRSARSARSRSARSARGRGMP